MKTKFFTLLLLSFCIGTTLRSQTIHPDCLDGQLYLKMSDASSIDFPIDARAEEIYLLEAIPNALKEVFKKYGLSKIQRAFKTRDAKLDRTFKLEFRSLSETAAFINDLQAFSTVEYAEMVPFGKVAYLPNDWSPLEDLYHLEVINAQAAWDISRGNPDVVIAVVDDAVMVNHEDLNSDIWVNGGEIPNNGLDDDGNGFVDDVNGFDVAGNNGNPNPPSDNFDHGTFVAGCAAAATDNNTGLPAIGFNCSIMGIRASSNANNRNISNGYEGVDYAINAGADIINMSWGGPVFSTTHQNLMNAAHRKGIILVAAAGNDNSSDIQYPVGYEHVIGVGATDRNDRKAGFSNFGGFVDIVAPGVDLLSTIPGGPNGSYGRSQGTSFSSPIVAGLLGLMKSVNPCLSPDQAEEILRSTADNIDSENPNFTGLLGAGRINAQAAVAAAANAEGAGTPPAPIAAFSFDNSDICSNKIPFQFELDPEASTCAFSLAYKWTIVDDAGFQVISTDRNPVVEFPASGEYSVTLRVNNAGGIDTKTELVNININPNAFIDAGEDLVLCQGDEIVLNASSSADIQAVSWAPATNLAATDVLQPSFNALRAGGTYKLTIEGGDGCVLVDSVQIDVFRNPFIQTTPAIDTVIASPGDSVQLFASGGITYAWSPAESLSDSSIANPIAFPLTNTVYTIVSTGVGGCASEKTIEVKINTTDIKQVLASQAIIGAPYPNPLSTSLNLTANFKEGTDLSIDLMDLQARTLKQIVKLKVPKGSWDYLWTRPTEIPAGIYVLRWQLGDSFFHQRIILE